MAGVKDKALEASSLHLIQLLVLILVSTAVSFLIPPMSAVAQGALTAQQTEIFRTALQPDGHLTEKEHREFWGPLKARIKTPGEITAFGKLLRSDMGSAIKFQRETWKSVELSQRAGKVTKTPGYEQAKNETLSIGVAPKEALAAGIDEAERMFVAVANKTAYQSKQGPIYLNEEQVQKVLTGLESTVCRLRRLTNPDWDAKKQEFRYQNAHLKILSECPVPIEFEEVTTENGAKVKMVTLSVHVSENEYIAISFTPLRGKWVDPNGSLVRVAHTSLSGFGVEGARPTVSDWRGMKSAVAGGSLKLPKGSINAAVRVVEGKSVSGSWTFLAASQTSLPNAQSALAEAEKHIMLD